MIPPELAAAPRLSSIGHSPKGALVAFGTSGTVFKATDVPLQAHRLRNTGSLFV